MTVLSVTQARAKLYTLINEIAASHDLIQITGKRHNAVLIGEDDWRSIQEALHLLSVPGMRKSIRKGLAAPVAKCDAKLKW